MYSFSGRIRYSELGADGKLRVQEVVNYFQDCCTFHSESIGRGVEYTRERGRTWVLSAWQIIISRLPGIGNEVTVQTWPYEFRGCFGGRNFRMLGAEGEVLAYANALYSLIDIHSGLPVRVTPEDAAGYELEEKLSMEYAPRKIPLAEGMRPAEEIRIRPHHLDTNQHVNNGQYVGMAAELLPEGFPLGEIRVEYKRQARLGDVICPRVYEEEGRCLTVLCDEAGENYCTVEFLARQGQSA